MLRLLRTKLSSHVRPALSYSTTTSPPLPLKNPNPKSLPRSPTTNSDPSSRTTLNFLKKSCGLSPEAARSAAKKIQLTTTDNPLAVLALLKSYGFSDTHIARLVAHRPNLLLLSSPDQTLKPKLDFYRGIGLSGPDFASLASANPGLLLWSLEERLIPNFNILKTVLYTKNNIISALKISTSLLRSDLQNALLPNINTLKDRRVPATKITDLAIRYPKALLKDPYLFKESMEVIKKMGIAPSDRSFAYALDVLNKLPQLDWEKKLERYKSFGWLEDHVHSAFARHPYCMAVSDESIAEKMGFFSRKLNWGPDYVSVYPVLLSLSFQKRIVPRWLVIRILKAKGLVKNSLQANHLIMAEKDFLKRFVFKYEAEAPEVVDFMQGKLEIVGLEE